MQIKARDVYNLHTGPVITVIQRNGIEFTYTRVPGERCALVTDEQFAQFTARKGDAL
jgi:ribose 5-phosphate isomerase RpiB